MILKCLCRTNQPVALAFFSRVPLAHFFRLNPPLNLKSSARMTAGSWVKWWRARELSETVTVNAPNPINLWAEIDFPEQHGACGKTVDCGRRWSLLFDGLPDQHCQEAPGRLVPGTDRLTSADRERLWSTSGECMTTCAQRGHTHTHSMN